MRFKIYRYDPESGARPRMQDYEIDFDPTGKKVLDVLIALKETLDESLSFRRSCREGVCGSDGFNVNASTLPEGIEEFVDLAQIDEAEVEALVLEAWEAIAPKSVRVKRVGA